MYLFFCALVSFSLPFFGCMYIYIYDTKSKNKKFPKNSTANMGAYGTAGATFTPLRTVSNERFTRDHKDFSFFSFFFPFWSLQSNRKLRLTSEVLT